MKHLLAKRQMEVQKWTHTHTANSVLPRNRYAVFIVYIRGRPTASRTREALRGQFYA